MLFAKPIFFSANLIPKLISLSLSSSIKDLTVFNLPSVALTSIGIKLFASLTKNSTSCVASSLLKNTNHNLISSTYLQQHFHKWHLYMY